MTQQRRHKGVEESVTGERVVKSPTDPFTGRRGDL